MANNLDIQLQLNELIAEQNKLLESSSKLLKDQVSLTQNLVSAMKSANFKDVASGVEETSRAVEEAAQKSKEFGSTNQDVFDKVNSSLKEALAKETATGKGMDSLTKQVKRFSVAASSIDGFVQGLRFTSNLLRTATSAGVGLVESLGQIGIAILSIPFKMLKGLVTMADAGGADTALAQALENIRKEFGSLRETSGRAIVDMAKNMKGQLAQTGLSVTRIFGNLAERLATLQEYAHNLGPLFSNLADQFVANAEAIGAYYKGLGLTEEAQKAVATRSYALGTAVTEELRQITNYSTQLSKAFNGTAGSAKEISRDMGTLMADFKHFGGIATKEIGQAVVYFRRLGVEVSKVMGVIERYDNFTDAAEGAAQLSQAFGLNVDALQMMKAQNPAERVEQLRKAFFQAGRSVETMTRQERTLLAQQTGLEDSALDLVFSMKNQGMSYDQVTKKADLAKKSQLTQTQAMKALADSIERLVKSGTFGSGGFFDRFIQGFSVGIQRSAEFRKIMRELRIDLRTAYYEGIKVGRAFVDMFPGVKDVFKGIADLFEPSRFRAMFTKVTAAFKDFFKDMTDNPQTALPKMMERLKKDFFEWFQGNSPNGQKILGGFRKFFVALSNIAGSMLKVAMTTLTGGIKELTKIISGERGLGGAGGAARNAQGFVSQLLGPIVDAIVEAGPSLWEATKKMFAALWTKAEPWVKANFLKVIGVLAGPAFVGMVGRAISTSIAGAFASGLVNWIQGGGVSKALGSVKGMFASQVQTASEAMSKLPIPTTPAASGAAGVVKGAEQAATAATTSKVNWGAALVKMAAITLFITVGMAGIMYAIFRFAKAMQENKLTTQSVAASAGAMVATATSMLAIAGAVKLLSAINLNAGMVGKIVIGVGMIGVVGAAMAYATVGLIKLFGDIQTSKITKSVLVMGAMGTFFLAAGAVTAIAGVIGLAATASGGIGALVIAAGMATIAATIGIMTTQGMAIMRAIDAFRPGPGFTDKAKIFIEVMKGVGQFAGNVAQMISATTPSFVDFIRGTGAAQQKENLKQVENLINALGGQITRIIGAIRTNVQGLTGSEQEVKAAQIIGDLLGGISGLANALKPPSETLSDPGFLQGLAGDTVSRRISLMTDYVNEVGNKLSQFVRTVVAVVTTNLPTGFSDSQAKAAQVIPSILSGVGDLAQALRPSAALLGEMNRGAQFHGVVQHMSAFISNTMRAITGSDLFAKIGDLLKSVAASVGNLNPSQAKSLQAIAPAIGPIFSTIASIGGIISGLAGGRGAGGDVGPAARATPADAGTIFQMTNLVNSFFARVKDDLPVLVNNMRQAFAGVSVREASNLARGMQAMQSLFQVVSSIPQFIQSFRGSAGDQGVGGITTLKDIGHTMNLLLVALTGTGSNRGVISVLQAIIPQVNNVTSTIGDPSAFTSKINAVKASFDALSRIPDMIRSLSGLTNIATVTENVTGQIQRVQFARIASVVTDMVSHVNQLSATIRGIRPIEIEQGLQRLGDSIGLGSEGEYTIQNRNFTVNVNVTIKLDNDGLDALELGMLRRVGPHPTRITHGSLER